MTTMARRTETGDEKEEEETLGGSFLHSFFLPYFIPLFFYHPVPVDGLSLQARTPFTLPGSLLAQTSSIIRSYRHRVTKSMTSAELLLLLPPPPPPPLLKRKKRTLGSLLRTWCIFSLYCCYCTHSAQTLNSLPLSLSQLNAIQLN